MSAGFKRFSRIVGWCGAIFATVFMVKHEYAHAAANWGYAVFWYLVGTSHD